MGIRNLAKVINKYHKPSERPLAFYRTKKIAFDASLLIYQYLIAIRSDGAQLTYNNASTSHISGFFYKIVNLAECGIRPIFVFDGKPPSLKKEVLDMRNERRKSAAKRYSEAKEKMDKIEMEKYDKRKIKIGKEHTDDIMVLLNAMGVPYVVSENEAEACCAMLCRRGIVDYVCTEDMDALCFKAPVILRNCKKDTVVEYRLNDILTDIKMSFNEFLDLSILLGCDYLGTIKGIGPTKAESLIRNHKSIENITKALNITDYKYEDARQIFLQMDSDIQVNTVGIDWHKYDRSKVLDFMLLHNFSEHRIVSALNRYEKCKQVKAQTRLTDIFCVKKR